MKQSFEDIRRFLGSLNNPEIEPVADQTTADPLADIKKLLASLNEKDGDGSVNLPVAEEFVDPFVDIKAFLRELETGNCNRLQNLSREEWLDLLFDTKNSIKESDLKWVLNSTEENAFLKGVIRSALIHSELKDANYLLELFNRFRNDKRWEMLAFFARNPNLPVNLLESIFRLIKDNELHHANDGKLLEELEKVKEVYLWIHEHPVVREAMKGMALDWVLELSIEIHRICDESGEEGAKLIKALS